MPNHTGCQPLTTAGSRTFHHTTPHHMNDKILKQARMALRWPNWQVLNTIVIFAHDKEYMAAMHHCEKMGKQRTKIMAALNQARHHA